MAETKSNNRKRARGVVKSDRMDKTVTVVVQRTVQHPLYHKRIQRRTTLMAHDPENVAREGDVVEVESTRPLSRRKRWRVVRVLRRSAQAVPPSALDIIPEEVAPEGTAE
jgi:small subunit ribosomal protein S17